MVKCTNIYTQTVIHDIPSHETADSSIRSALAPSTQKADLLTHTRIMNDPSSSKY